MKSTLLAITIGLLVGSALVLSAKPATCENCLSGYRCYNDGMCGQGCDCVLINGLGQPGVCG